MRARQARFVMLVALMALLGSTPPGAAGQADPLCDVQAALADLIPGPLDCDGDGYSPLQGDCDDTDPDMYPGAPPKPDGKDNDCDGVVSPEEDIDADGDGWTVGQGDCDDNDPSIHPGAVDEPDLDFRDTNCDGIDGDIARAIFVAPDGDDEQPGTIDQPVHTIEAAVTLADSQGKDVYVREGSYGQTAGVTLRSGVGIYGGYDAAWARRADAVSLITGRPQAVFANGVSDVTLQLLHLEGSAGATTGTRNAYGLRAISSSLILERVTVVAGAGLPGPAGMNGPNGVQGSAGQPGAPGHCDANVSAPGGAGGGSVLYPGGKGGDGRHAQSGLPGQNGAGPSGGAGGAGGVLGSGGARGGPGANGGDGGPGAQGANGGGGSSAVTATGSHAVGGNGGSGTAGQAGSGGGGGGAGGGQTGFFVIDGTGNGGGGGGGGGGHGVSGSGGSFGGGSFGLFLVNATVTARDATVIQAGDGGAGGNGGSGGLGAPGGAGGNGASVCTEEVGPGGRGGNGGQGGSGGHGGGGAGGASIGVFVGNSSFTLAGSPAPSVGTPGAGGSSAGSSGAPGIAASIYP